MRGVQKGLFFGVLLRPVLHCFTFFFSDSFLFFFHSFISLFQILLYYLRRNYIFLKESVKGDYTKSYKVLVTQDSYRVISDFFWIFLESHVIPRAQRAAQDS